MKCPKCHTENRGDRKFCLECGEKLIIPCPDCGFENFPDEKFCGEFGRDLKQLDQEKSIFPRLQSQTPTSFADSRYEVKEFLGEGGNNLAKSQP